MTSNQLTYWRDEETKRANKAREDENIRHNMFAEGESVRHNVAVENESISHNRAEEEISRAKNEISKIQTDLQAQGIEVEKAANLSKLNELYAKYGVMAMAEAPEATRRAYEDALGLASGSLDNPSTEQVVTGVMNEVLRIIGTIGKFLTALF